MGLMVFLSACLLLVLSSYYVLRSVLRSRKSYSELLLEIKPLSPRATELIWKSTQGPIPPTWIDVADLIRIRRNSSIFTMLSDRFRRLIRQCSNERDAAEMENTYRFSLRSHEDLTKSLLMTFLIICFGKIGYERCSVHMASVAKSYAHEVMSAEEMTEVIDHRSLPILEGQFIHGS